MKIKHNKANVVMTMTKKEFDSLTTILHDWDCLKCSFEKSEEQIAIWKLEYDFIKKFDSKKFENEE